MSLRERESGCVPVCMCVGEGGGGREQPTHKQLRRHYSKDVA